MASYQYSYVMKNLKKSFPGGRDILKGVTLSFLPDVKIGVLGVNGAGKSTLLRIMAGLETEFAGEAWAAEGASVGFLPQEPELDETKDVRGNVLEGKAEMHAALRRFEEVSARFAEPLDDEEMAALIEEQGELQDQIEAADGWQLDRTVEMAMAALGCPPPDAQVATLSGGERRRVALCRLTLQCPDLLLLDEPTNHLDLDMRQALEQALQGFAGAVVLVAHDRHLIDATCDTLLRVHDGRLDVFDGDLDDYARWLRSTLSQPRSSTDISATAAKTSARRKRQDAAERRAREKPLRNALKKVERDMGKLQSTLAWLDEKLADPGLYEASKSAELTRLNAERGRAAKTLEALETEWLETGEALESLAQD
jgi:ATPase subunit of ABC transporter with duplicated ATPase domains